jgi:hypothetical protein
MPEPPALRGTAGPPSWRHVMNALLVGYARCTTEQQDLSAQRGALLGLGVKADRIYA